MEHANVVSFSQIGPTLSPINPIFRDYPQILIDDANLLNKHPRDVTKILNLLLLEKLYFIMMISETSI
jgi:hypothetical protein